MTARGKYRERRKSEASDHDRDCTQWHEHAQIPSEPQQSVPVAGHGMGAHSLVIVQCPAASVASALVPLVVPPQPDETGAASISHTRRPSTVRIARVYTWCGRR
jgi:hypothetical protein